MNTPILDFVKEYSNKDMARMHMPGHKGKEFLGYEHMDITEIKGADSLYHADGIIAASEKNAEKLFESGVTAYSTEGSSLCIKTMLYLAILEWRKSNQGKRPVVVAARNAHISFIHAAMLLDFDVKWIWPENSDGNILSCDISLEKLKEAIDDNQVAAVYITSPDYLGSVSDIRSISRLCHDNNKLLIVDNAHGAYLKFVSENKYSHPLDLGADMCCDSAHKTFPVLTGGAYLHINNRLNSISYKDVKLAMNIFGSTSPSYLILESLDLCNKYLGDGYKEKLTECILKINTIKMTLKALGYCILESDPLKITIRVNGGIALASNLRENKIESEYADNEFVVLMLTPENNEKDLERLLAVLASEELLQRNSNQKFESLQLISGETIVNQCKYTIREAMLMPQERIPIDKALGRVCGAPLVSCPPAIPIVVSGEIITEFALEILKRYNIESVQCTISTKN